MNIEDLRKNIDGIDREIIKLFERRIELSSGVSDYKKENGLPLFDPARERDVIAARVEMLEDKELTPFAKRMVTELMELSKAYQLRRGMGGNIVLTGMMGSGKSCKGRLLAERLCMDFADLDAAVEDERGMSISDIFARFGEDSFRESETAAAKKYAEKTGYVIATGGGVVLRDCNMEALKRSGKVFFLNRNIEEIAADIDVSARPILKNGSEDGSEAIFEIYNSRLALYRKWCDFEMTDSGSVERCVEEIIKALYQ